MKKVNESPNSVKDDAQQGKHRLREGDDFSSSVMPTRETGMCLPPVHMKAALKCTHKKVVTGRSNHFSFLNA